MKFSTLLALASLSPLVFGYATAAGNPERGLELSETCQTCHGVEGNTTVDENTPRLAGQHYDYLVRALKDYRDGVRNNAIMAGFTQDLSDQDIRDLAAWYASQEGLVELRIR